MPHPLPLAGIKVLDLSRLLPGPVASMHLADMGAEVLKIEDKGVGDYARSMGPVRHSVSQFFIAVNRGKQFLQLDLKDPADKQRFLGMVAEADVVLESFRPGVMDKLGLGWEVLKQHNPRLVMCAISGYGQDGPFAQLAGHDINYLGYSGMLEQNAEADGNPVLPNLQVGDLLGGAQTAVQGILAGLLAANRHGRGSFVDVSMTDAVFAHNIMPLVAVNHQGKVNAAAQDLLTGGAPCYNVYRTSDDRHMAVGALEPKFWELLCDTLHKPEYKRRHWAYGQRVGGSDAQALKSELATIFRQHTLAHWIAIFVDVDCCVSPVLRTEEALQHPLFQARQMAKKMQHDTEGEYWGTGSAPKFRD